LIELFTSAFITLAVIIDPPGCAPIFAGLTKGTADAHRRAMAIRSAVVAWCILLFFALLALLTAGPLMRLIGAKIEAMITRILGVILAALAVQFVLDGLERSLPGLAG
jgi:multiple antibiotic resistance protein